MEDAQSSWRAAGDHFKSLGKRLRQTYRTTAGDTVGDAAQRVGDAMERLAQAVREAIADEELRREAATAIESTINAIGETFDRIGDRMFQRADQEEKAASESEAGQTQEVPEPPEPGTGAPEGQG